MADTRTLQNLVDRTANELARDDLAPSSPFSNRGQASILNAVLDSIHDYQRDFMFQFEKTDESKSTSSGTREYDPPSDLMSIIQIAVLANDTVYTLGYRTIQELNATDSQVSSPSLGIPVYYTWWANQVWLYPRPNGVYTIRYIYWAAEAAPEALTDSNFWTTTAESLVRNRAKWKLNMEVIRNPEQAQLDQQAEFQAYLRMKTETAVKTTGGRLRSTKF